MQRQPARKVRELAAEHQPAPVQARLERLEIQPQQAACLFRGQPAEIAQAVMPAGTAAVYLGTTLHGAGTNRSAESWRRGLHLSYVVGWLRTEENNVLATPPEIARTLPERAQRLLGYGVHDAISKLGGYVGMVGLRDPIDLLREGKLR